MPVSHILKVALIDLLLRWEKGREALASFSSMQLREGLQDQQWHNLVQNKAN